MKQRGFSLIEMAVVLVITAILIFIGFKAFNFQAISAASKADYIYQTSATMARNWQQLALAANAPTSQGGVYWTPTNPLFACATTNCVSTGNNGQDAQRVVRVLAEGPSAMNPAYVTAWAKSGLTPIANILHKNPNDPIQYMMGDYSMYVWGNGSNGNSNGWAMGPFSIWICNVPDDVATILAAKYYGLAIDPTTMMSTGSLHVGPVGDPVYGCGPGVRQTILNFQV